DVLLDYGPGWSQIHAPDGQPAEARPALRRAAPAHLPLRRKLSVWEGRPAGVPSDSVRPPPVRRSERAAPPPAPARPPGGRAAPAPVRLATAAPPRVRDRADRSGTLPRGPFALHRGPRGAALLADPPARPAARPGAPSRAPGAAHRGGHA